MLYRWTSNDIVFRALLACLRTDFAQQIYFIYYIASPVRSVMCRRTERQIDRHTEGRTLLDRLIILPGAKIYTDFAHFL